MQSLSVRAGEHRMPSGAGAKDERCGRERTVGVSAVGAELIKNEGVRYCFLSGDRIYEFVSSTSIAASRKPTTQAF
jgi:hypothetical protein